jgi:hypothetical protein
MKGMGVGVAVGTAVFVGAVVAVGKGVALGAGVGAGVDAGAQANSIRLMSKNTSNVRFIVRILLSLISPAQRFALVAGGRALCWFSHLLDLIHNLV